MSAELKRQAVFAVITDATPPFSIGVICLNPPPGCQLLVQNAAFEFNADGYSAAQLICVVLPQTAPTSGTWICDEAEAFADEVRAAMPEAQIRFDKMFGGVTAEFPAVITEFVAMTGDEFAQRCAQ